MLDHNTLQEIAEVFHSYGIENVILKLGKDGVYADTPKEKVSVGTYAAEEVRNKYSCSV